MRGRLTSSFVSSLVLLARRAMPETGEHILAHKVRRAMLEAVAARPGITLGELRRVVAMGWGNSYHHLGTLERAGLVRRQRIGRRLVLFATGSEAVLADAAARGYLRGETARSVAEDIHANPGTNVNAIAERLALTTGAVYHHVSRLRELGLVTARPPSRQFALETTRVYLGLRAEDGASARKEAQG